jgi:hypothetical protein
LYAAGTNLLLSEQEAKLTSFTVNPGYFRDDPSKYRDLCKPELLFTPCPQCVNPAPSIVCGGGAGSRHVLVCRCLQRWFM